MTNTMKHSEECPLCHKDSSERIDISVCQVCHAGLQVTGLFSVSQTGEYSTMSATEAKKILGSDDITRDPSIPVCTWCDAPKDRVKQLITRGEHHICNECVGLCVDMLSIEFGDAWRK